MKSGILGFERQLEADRNGQKPLFRPREWHKEERRRKISSRYVMMRDSAMSKKVKMNTLTQEVIRGRFKKKKRNKKLTNVSFGLTYIHTP